jgi:hypothetical protein
MTQNHNATPPPVTDPVERLRRTLLEQRRAGLLLVDSAERELRQLGWQPGENGRRARRGRISADTKEGNGG